MLTHTHTHTHTHTLYHKVSDPYTSDVFLIKEILDGDCFKQLLLVNNA